ncbi:MAG: DNA methyltransferase [Candidatus Hodarchaeales archaeon]
MPNLPLKPYQEDRDKRGIYDRRNVLNDLTGKEWLFSTKTIIPKIYPTNLPSSLINNNHFFLPVVLRREIIETFSKPEGKILDPFLGSEFTLLAGHTSNLESSQSAREIIGIKHNQNSFVQFKDILTGLNINSSSSLKYESEDYLKELNNKSIDFIITDLRIFNQEKGSESLLENNFSFYSWIENLKPKITQSIDLLKDNHYFVISLPFCDHSLSATSERIQEWNFALTPVVASILESSSCILKAERFWFEPTTDENQIQLVPPKRRILVFRKELIPTPMKVSTQKDLQSQKLVGQTLIHHKGYPPSFEHKLRSQHGGMKPPELIEFLIRRYSSENHDLIFDPFVGVGGTLLGASLANRNAFGIDKNPKWRDIYEEVCFRMNINPLQYLVGDSRSIVDKSVSDGSLGLIMTDVPYWAMDKLVKTRGRFSKAGEHSRDKLPSSLKKFDQTEILSIEEWKKLMQEVFTVCYKKLGERKHLVVFIGNMYRTLSEVHDGKAVRVGRFLLLSSLLADLLVSIGYKFLEEVVWYAPDKALHIFGYPYSYIPSVVHQDILVFEK